MNKVYIFFFIISFSFLGCQQKTFNSETELLEYLKNDENDYIQHKHINGIDISLMFKPNDLLVNQEIRINSTKNEVDLLKKKYQPYMYFILSLSKNNKELLSSLPSDRDEFAALVNKLSFGMNNHIYLITSKKDTIKSIDYSYSRMYGMGKSTSLMFVYPKDEKLLKSNYLNFVIQDFGLNTGEIKFKIKTKKIINEPKIKFTINE